MGVGIQFLETRSSHSWKAEEPPVLGAHKPRDVGQATGKAGREAIGPTHGGGGLRVFRIEVNALLK